MRCVAASAVAVVVLSLAGGLLGTAAGAASTPSAKGVSAGPTDSCALLSSGAVQCWGYNSNGLLGNGTTKDSLTPVVVKGISGARAVSVGTDDICALLSGGTVKCWGVNTEGQLGNGTTSVYLSLTPVAVKGLSGVTAISAGDDNACALLSGGTLKCWGLNSLGGLGNGTTTNASTPVVVKGIRTARAVSVGGLDGCALLSGGTVKCWGAGALGNGTTTNSSTPVAVKGITTATAVSTGPTASCALLSAGTIQCWGKDAYGQQSLTPVTVPGITTAKSVSAAAFLSTLDTCALLSGGTIDCWGSNTSGELGNGTISIVTPNPVTVSGISTATEVSTGGSGTCALLSGGTVKCWGIGSYDRLGNGTYADSSTPVVVRLR